MQFHISVPKVSYVVVMILGILAAVYAFITNSPAHAVEVGACVAALGVITLAIGRKTTEELQMIVAGLFMASLSVLIGLWEIYH
ncbi:hypothetical protein [Chitinophaga parva]|nr:hypothetical protein [Chitinophaga parva]